jgi:prefoldin subunit 5
VQSLAVHTGAGADSINVTAAAAVPISIDGGTDADTIHFDGESLAFVMTGSSFTTATRETVSHSEVETLALTSGFFNATGSIGQNVIANAAGILGGSVADVIPGQSTEVVGWGDRLPGETGAGLFDKMDALAGQADKVAVQMQGLLSDKMVGDVQGSAAGARQSLDSLQAILNEQRSEIRALTTSLRRSAEGVEKVATGPELEQTVKRMDAIVARLDGTVDTLDRSSKSVQSVINRIDRGEGTLGKLSTDEELYKNANEAVANLNKATTELNKLLVDFQAHPRKYINLKIF